MTLAEDRTPATSVTRPPTLGILGGGQLGRMTALAAATLGIDVVIYNDVADCPAAAVVRHTVVGSFTDQHTLKEFAQMVDVITYESENINADSVEFLEHHTPVFPSSRILRITQHRIAEKNFCKEQGIPTAPFAVVTTEKELELALDTIEPPAVLKTTRMGYDGKGQCRIESRDQAAAAWKTLNTDEAILEKYVDFEREISVIVARNTSGASTAYPTVQNIHENHILRRTVAPAPLSPALHEKAQRYALKLADGLNLFGLLAVEMFVTRSGDILVNEMAPRPHNSGHWTMDGCQTSQFEQLVRAVFNLPLGATDILHPTEMVNILGDEARTAMDHLHNPRARLHLYGKKDIRDGRKMGHVNILKT